MHYRRAAGVGWRRPGHIEDPSVPRNVLDGRRGRLYRLLKHVVEIDGHLDRLGATVAVVGLHGNRVAALGLVVVVRAGPGADLSGRGADREGSRIRALQRVGVASAVVRRGHRRADVDSGSRSIAHVFVETADPSAPDLRRIGVGGPASGAGPGAVAVGVGGTDLDVVTGVRIQTGNCRARTGPVLRPVLPVLIRFRALLVLEVVTRDRRPARIRRRRPRHGQACRTARHRRHARRIRRQRQLFHVGDVDRHGDGIGAAAAVVGLHRDRIAAVGLAVVVDAGAGADLAARGDDREQRLVRALQRVGQRVVVVVVRRHRRPDSHAGSRSVSQIFLELPRRGA